MGIRKRLGWLVVAALVSSALHAAPADDVKALLDQGRPAEAYALGKKHPDQLGSPSFDFYFGVAAIDSGHAGEGVLALERYITNFPDNQTARLELARGYFVLGDDARAREEFDLVLKSNPPPNVQANVQRFMDAIRARESRYQTTAGFYAEFGLGTDSNVNAGAGSNITLPGGLRLSLANSTAAKTGDEFATLAAGASVVHPILPGLALFGAANVDGKAHRHDSQFDQHNINAAGGLSYLDEKNTYRGTVSWGELRLDDNWYRHVQAYTGEVNHQLDELQMIGGSLQYGRLRYSGGNQPRDTDLYAAGLSYRRAFIGGWQPLLTLAGNLGEERTQRSRRDFGREFWGGRVALAVTPAPKWAVSVGASFQESKYKGPDAIANGVIALLTGRNPQIVRRDRNYGLDAAVSYALNRNWSLRGEYGFTKNDSNLSLYEYDRHILALKVRWEFK